MDQTRTLDLNNGRKDTRFTLSDGILQLSEGKGKASSDLLSPVSSLCSIMKRIETVLNRQILNCCPPLADVERQVEVILAVILPTLR